MGRDQHSETIVTIDRSGARASVNISGDMDLAVVDRIQRHVTTVVDLGGVGEVHLDCRDVTFIDSSGLRILVTSRETVLERGLDFSMIVAADGPVLRLLRLSEFDNGLVDHLAIHPRQPNDG